MRIASVQQIKIQLFHAQGGKCCYCGKPVRLRPVERWGNGIPAPDDFATLEHLQRQADGGTSEPHNVALACFACNNERDQLAMNWVEYKTLVEARAA
jgi:hypothetical protein